MPNTVFTVDDNQIMRQAVARLFKTAGGFQVCGEAANGTEAIGLAQALHPDLIVLDLCMPGLNGLETASQLKKLGVSAEVILYTMNAEEIATRDTLPSGVSALVSKAEGVMTLITKARVVLGQSAA
jgi:DNA-binding NarL/FixJ family response regulator